MKILVLSSLDKFVKFSPPPPCTVMVKLNMSLSGDREKDIFKFNIHGSVHRNNILVYNSN
jgi:hypothetical protein